MQQRERGCCPDRSNAFAGWHQSYAAPQSTQEPAAELYTTHDGGTATSTTPGTYVGFTVRAAVPTYAFNQAATLQANLAVVEVTGYTGNPFHVLADRTAVFDDYGQGYASYHTPVTSPAYALRMRWSR